MITLIQSDKKKPDSRYDPKSKKWVSYKIDIRGLDGKRIRPRFATKKEAQDFIDRIRGQRKDTRAGLRTPTQSPRISELFQARLKVIQNKKEHTRATRVFKAFRDLLEFDQFVTDIRKAHFQKYINSRSNVKASTVDREITVLSAAFHTAPELFPEALDHYEPSIARPKYNKGTPFRHIISEREKDLIVNSIANDRLTRERKERTESRAGFAKMFEFAWLLGLRFSEAKTLKQSDYDRHSGILLVRRGKTKTLTPMEHLPKRAVELIGNTDPIFDIKCSDHTLNDIIKKACENNGISYGRVVGMTFHSTRHSFTSRLTKVTDIATAASFTGHSNKEMVAYYSHASDESKRAAMEALYGESGLRDIFEKVRDKELDFEAFERLILARKF